MLRPPNNYVAAALAEHLTRDHPIPKSIPVRAAPKKEPEMTDTTFEVLELLALYVTAQLRRQFNETLDLADKAVITDHILHLDRRMDKLRHEQKGGA